MAYTLGIPDLTSGYLQGALRSRELDMQQQAQAEAARRSALYAQLQREQQMLQAQNADRAFRYGMAQDAAAADRADRAFAAQRDDAAARLALQQQAQDRIGQTLDLGAGYRGVYNSPNSLDVMAPPKKPWQPTPADLESIRMAGMTVIPTSDGAKVVQQQEKTPVNEPITDPISKSTVGFYDQAGKAHVYPQKDETSAGKQLTAEQAKRLSDLVAVQQSLPKLKEAYDKIANNWTTGPVMGRGPIAAIAGANDPNIKTLEAQLDQITPALARGVFGEVGVLTDSDVARYRALLPSRLHNKDVANALFNSLNDKVGTTLQSVIQGTKDSGYDVSGFEKYLPSASAPAAAPAGAAAPALPTVSSKAELDALPSGAEFLSNGRRYRKP